MKHLKSLTREQKIAVSIAGYLPDSWQLEEETEFYLKIVHKKFDVKRTVDRYAIICMANMPLLIMAWLQDMNLEKFHQAEKRKARN